MKRKRLNHVAFTVCHMFCGWRLVNSYKEISRLGTGSLRINCLTAECAFNGEKIPNLSIAEEIKFWFQKDLTDNNIPVENIKLAQLTAELELNVIGKKQRSTPSQFFTPEGKPVKSDKINQCKISCESKIVTDTATYSGKYADIEEWPDSFITW